MSEAYREHVPTPALARVVDRYWTRRDARPSSGDAHRILPDGCVDVLFHLGARPRAVVVGAMTRAHVTAGGPSEIVAVRFRPGGAARFFDVPVDTLTDAHVDLRDLGVAAGPTLDALVTDRTDDARRAALEALVLSRVSRRPRIDPSIDRAIAALVRPEAPTIETLAASLGVTRQHLARRVRAAVGLAPKQLARIARVQRVLVDLARGRRDLAALSVDHGFFDQAHLTNDVRGVTGLPPAALAASGSILPIATVYDVATVSP